MRSMFRFQCTAITLMTLPSLLFCPSMITSYGRDNDDDDSLPLDDHCMFALLYGLVSRFSAFVGFHIAGIHLISSRRIPYKVVTVLLSWVHCHQ